MAPTVGSTRVFRASSTLLVLTLAATLLTLAAPPAAAKQTGAGTANGTEQPAAQTTADPSFPLCLALTPGSGNVLYDLDGEGTYTGTGGLGNVMYSTVGVTPLDIKIKANDQTGTYYINPVGTFSQSSCELAPEAPYGVPVDVTIQAGTSVRDSAGSTCDGTGTFTRANSTVVVEWQLTETCMVDGNVLPGAGTAPSGTLHTFEGHFTPCEPTTCDALEGEEAQLVGEYCQGDRCRAQLSGYCPIDTTFAASAVQPPDLAGDPAAADAAEMVTRHHGAFLADPAVQAFLDAAPQFAEQIDALLNDPASVDHTLGELIALGQQELAAAPAHVQTDAATAAAELLKDPDYQAASAQMASLSSTPEFQQLVEQAASLTPAELHQELFVVLDHSPCHAVEDVEARAWKAAGYGMAIIGTAIVTGVAVAGCLATLGVGCAVAAAVGGTLLAVGTAAVAAGDILDD